MLYLLFYFQREFSPNMSVSLFLMKKLLILMILQYSLFSFIVHRGAYIQFLQLPNLLCSSPDDLRPIKAYIKVHAGEDAEFDCSHSLPKQTTIK